MRERVGGVKFGSEGEDWKVLERGDISPFCSVRSGETRAEIRHNSSEAAEDKIAPSRSSQRFVMISMYVNANGRTSNYAGYAVLEKIYKNPQGYLKRATRWIRLE